LLFIPANAPGLKAVFNYYTSTLKLTAEGDVVMDSATSSLGMTLDFLKTSLFGAVIQLVPRSPPPSHPILEDEYTTVMQPDYIPDAPDFDHRPHTFDAPPESDPHIPTKPARRKSQLEAPPESETKSVAAVHLKLTDFVPDVGYFIAGGVSGITSRTATAPLDRLKVYLIAQTGVAAEAVSAAKSGEAVKATKQASRTLWVAMQELWAAGGIKSLFAGKCLLVLLRMVNVNRSARRQI